MATYLDKILAEHRERISADSRSLDALVEKVREADDVNGRPRGFISALESVDGLGVIAEIKRRSPSKGDLNPDLDPADVARGYVKGDATCLSVLTDKDFFGGSKVDLQTARQAVPVPVLRKDFTVGAVDIVDARLMGADAVLLIVAALDSSELRDFYDLATELGLDCLVETHDENEVEQALEIQAKMIGVNQRDLTTFEVDTQRALRLLSMIDPDVVRVAESGIKGPTDAGVLFQAGYEAVLVGESVVTSGDTAAAVQGLRTCGDM